MLFITLSKGYEMENKEVTFNLHQFYLTVNNMERKIFEMLEEYDESEINYHEVYEEEKSDIFSDEVITIIISVVKSRIL